MDAFKNKYRISSTRMQKWNYGWVGSYFVTICTHAKEYFFGEIKDGKMVLSQIGEIVESGWKKTPLMRPDMNIALLGCVVMPNHFHGIVHIGRNFYNNDVSKNLDEMQNYGGANHGDTDNGDAMHCVSTTNKFGPQSKNLASIIRGFKSAVTKNVRLVNSDFAWQSRFYDHIIRDEQSFNKISKYIKNNPLNWKGDEFNSENPDMKP